MTDEQVNAVRVPENQSLCLMDQEIEGTRVSYHYVQKGDRLVLPSSDSYIRVLLLCAGKITIINNAKTLTLQKRGVCAGAPTDDIKIVADDSSAVMELDRWLTKEEYRNICESSELPFLQIYDEAPTYTEVCKSAKTISRMLIPQHLIPRLAMGSVETYGDDVIAQHTHPMLEQFFFSFTENNCVVLIDDMEYNFHGSTLLHIPLGSSHGVRLSGDQAAHYVWMDFLFDEEGVKYINETHQMNGLAAGPAVL